MGRWGCLQGRRQGELCGGGQLRGCAPQVGREKTPSCKPKTRRLLALAGRQAGTHAPSSTEKYRHAARLYSWALWHGTAPDR